MAARMAHGHDAAIVGFGGGLQAGGEGLAAGVQGMTAADLETGREKVEAPPAWWMTQKGLPCMG